METRAYVARTIQNQPCNIEATFTPITNRWSKKPNLRYYNSNYTNTLFIHYCWLLHHQTNTTRETFALLFLRVVDHYPRLLLSIIITHLPDFLYVVWDHLTPPFSLWRTTTLFLRFVNERKIYPCLLYFSSLNLAHFFYYFYYHRAVNVIISLQMKILILSLHFSTAHPSWTSVARIDYNLI